MPVTAPNETVKTELTDAARANVSRLKVFFAALRSSQKIGAELQIKPEDFATLKDIFLHLVTEVDFTLSLTDSGMPVGNSFTDETFRIIKGKILPYLHNENDAGTIIKNLLQGPDDYLLLKNLLNRYDLSGDNFSSDEKAAVLTALRIEVLNSVRVLSYRIAALGTHEEIYVRAGKEEALLTPFIEQNREVNELLTNIEQSNAEKTAEDFAQTKVMLHHCLDNIKSLDKAGEKYGASLQQTFLLRKLECLIMRLEKLLPIVAGTDVDSAFKELLQVITEIALLDVRPQNLWQFVSQNINRIAYRITENKRRTGEHYIAANRAEYYDLFISAGGGGFVVAFMVIVKLLVHHAGLPLLWEAVAYSLVYATGFAAIHIWGLTLATKQPAMTAAYIAGSMDDIGDNKMHYRHLAATIATVSRSQLVSFAGNLVIVFPVSLFLIFILAKLSAQAPVTPAQGTEMLNAVHPLHSLSFLYAGIAGAYLFIAGIISGFGDNKAVVSRIGARLEAHPFLKKHMAAEKRRKLAEYIERNLGPLIGNIILGFMLGTAGFIGNITGLPFDIRHVTFSAGNVALGFYGTGFSLSLTYAVGCLVGLVIIGFMNFAVSFALALEVAARSRGIRLKDYPELLRVILLHFKHHWRHFFWPPNNDMPANAVGTDNSASVSALAD